MIGALQAIGIVVAFAITWTCGSVWHTGRRRKRAIARREADRPVGIPVRSRIDSGRRQVPHHSDEGRP